MAFCDSEKFNFKDGFPVHKKDVGEKEGFLNNRGTWADAVINNVPLHVTFQNEDMIDVLSNSFSDDREGGSIIVNAREMAYNRIMDDGYEGEKWSKRLKKMKIGPMTFKESKERRPSKNKRDSKPKTDIQVSKGSSQGDKFMELIERNDHGIMKKNELQWQWSGSSLIHSDKRGGQFSFFPPPHWLEPVMRWDLIWSKIDEIETGKKRDYIYVKDGETYRGFTGPAMFFYNGQDKEWGFNFDWSKDFIYGDTPYNGETMCSFRPFTNENPNYGLNDVECVLCPTGHSMVNQAEEEYLYNPCDATWENYDVLRRNWVDDKRNIYSGWPWTTDITPSPIPHI